MRILSSVVLVFAVILAYAQPPDTPGSARVASVQKRQALAEMSLIKNLKFENIGPTIFSGRVTDVDADPKDPTHFYVAYASGGLWYTDNNGADFTPVFDHEGAMTIGDIAVDWTRGIIWVGTGENNSSRSSYSGLGLYQSIDHGKTWSWRGLAESHHISRIVLDPDDPNIIQVAVLGSLYSANKNRGVYRTSDGGRTWDQTLFVDQNTGAADLIQSAANKQVLFAATWERTRRAWDFTESGAGSGIYKSKDGGLTWQLMTGKASGFPAGPGTGRIGLAITSTAGHDLIYAILDNYNRRPAEPMEDSTLLTKDALRKMSKTEFLGLQEDVVAGFLEDNGFPEKYTSDTIMELVRTDIITPYTLVEYLEDANAQLFDTEVIGAEVYVSRDGGTTWHKTHEDYLDGLYYSYGYYFGQIRVSPFDTQKIYVLGVPILMSEDGGVSWKAIGGDNVHGDHHALWLSDSRDKHLILGNDGGINISYDDGAHWIKCNSPAVGQFYSVQTDRAKPYQVYGGLQDNGVWAGSHLYRTGTSWHSSGDYPYDFLFGGDGMQVQVDFRDNETVFTGFQFGNYARINKRTGDRTFITPRHELSERPYRWNWQTPIWLSRHQQDILYMGSQYVHRSLDQGNRFEIISGDLTKGGRQGDVPYGTLTTIHESPLQFGLLYAGSDDGLIHVSLDFGRNWKRISDGLPQDLWVSRVRASAHVTSRAYVTLNGYRWDHFTPYLYVSEDYGASWMRLGLDIPEEPINVMMEDPVNSDLLYVGTDNGLYISMDRGKHFMPAGLSLPAVAVHDLDIQPIAGHLLVGTHGRSFYKADLSQLQLLNTEMREAGLHVFEIPSSGMRYRDRWGSKSNSWNEHWIPEIEIPVFADQTSPGSLTVLFEDQTVFSKTIDLERGLNYLVYDLSVSSEFKSVYAQAVELKDPEVKVKEAENGMVYLRTGKYTIQVSRGIDMTSTPFELK